VEPVQGGPNGMGQAEQGVSQGHGKGSSNF
jgi:hypothetical protein